MTQYMFQSNTSTTAAQNHECYLMHLRIKTNIPKQTVFACSFSLSPLSTNNLNTKFHRAFSAMTVPTFLSLSALQCLNCQANQTASNFSSKVTSANVRQAEPHCSCTLPNLRCSTTHVLSQYHIHILLM